MNQHNTTRLSVNINKIATLRNARGANNPDLVATAIYLQRLGAQGITVHPRPDERHIRRLDVFDLRPVVTTEFNIEGYPSDEFLQLVEAVQPEQVTLVPDKPGDLTSSAGWDVVANAEFLTDVVCRLHRSGHIRVSIFVNPDPEQARAAKAVGADRIELYTKPYADAYHENREQAIEPYIRAAQAAVDCGLGVNGGHDLDLYNLHYFYQRTPGLNEVSIGHALVCDALYMGYPVTIAKYLACLRP